MHLHFLPGFSILPAGVTHVETKKTCFAVNKQKKKSWSRCVGAGYDGHVLHFCSFLRLLVFFS